MDNNYPSQPPYYLRVGKASDFKNIKERIIYKIFEIIPGFVSWAVLFTAVFLSWHRPFWIAIFIIIFAFYWFLRTIYFSIHLWHGYREMEGNERTNWLAKIRELGKGKYSLPFNRQGLPISSWEEIYHLIVMPVYEEPKEIIRASLVALDFCDYPKEKIIVVLACEERARVKMEAIVKEIENEFSSKFFKFLVTWHPDGLAGEIQSKGANETWGTKMAKEKIIDPLKISYEKVIFSSFDIDTCAPKGYFSRLTYCYLTTLNPTRASYQPVPIFTNNIWQAPVFSRLISFSSTFWYIMLQGRQEKLITFSSHSMSFKALVDVGFKQTNVVSDDSRIFWQCFFRYQGDYRTEPLYYPLFMDANVAKNFWKTSLNLYRQQRRWAYGVGDIPYFLFGFIKDNKIPLSKKFFLGWDIFGGHFSWAVSSVLIFLLGWLPIYFGGQIFSCSVMCYTLPKVVSRIMFGSMVGAVFSCYISFLILPPKPPEYGKFKYLVFALIWIIFPFIMIIFGAIPALEAQTRWMFGRYLGFWVTEKQRKK